MGDTCCYSERLDRALALMAKAFRNKRRKGSGVPYLSHLLQVMVWVAEYGGDEDQMIAGLLHDYLEDIDGAEAVEVEEFFGPRVRQLVEALSDAQSRPKPPWRARKERYIAQLRDAPPEVKLICACDKLHNALSMVRDTESEGAALFDRFSAGRDGTLWYYRQVLAALRTGWDHPILSSLREAVLVMHRQAGAEWTSSEAW